MAWYAVDLRCECGETHRVSNRLQLTPGPTEAGTMAELYPAGDLPPGLARLLGDLLWCDRAGEYIEIADPARLVLTPWPSFG